MHRLLERFRRPALDRALLARVYLRGDGIEIGALNAPLRVPRAARVRYVDRMRLPELLQQYPELSGQPLARVDIVDDGETLASLADGSQDFVIANHFLEHCHNPLGAVENMLRVLKPGGVVYLAIPEKRMTFDADRPVTPLSHLLEVHRTGTDAQARQHYEEWTRLVNKVTDPVRVQQETDHLLQMRYAIHFHVWTEDDMMEMVLALKRELGLSFETDAAVRNGQEVVFILRRR